MDINMGALVSIINKVLFNMSEEEKIELPTMMEMEKKETKVNGQEIWDKCNKFCMKTISVFA